MHRVIYKCPKCYIKPMASYHVERRVFIYRCQQCCARSEFSMNRTALAIWNEWAASEFARRAVQSKG